MPVNSISMRQLSYLILLTVQLTKAPRTFQQSASPSGSGSSLNSSNWTICSPAGLSVADDDVDSAGSEAVAVGLPEGVAVSDAAAVPVGLGDASAAVVDNDSVSDAVSVLPPKPKEDKRSSVAISSAGRKILRMPASKNGVSCLETSLLSNGNQGVRGRRRHNLAGGQPAG